MWSLLPAPDVITTIYSADVKRFQAAPAPEREMKAFEVSVSVFRGLFLQMIHNEPVFSDCCSLNQLHKQEFSFSYHIWSWFEWRSLFIKYGQLKAA